jgi:pyrrolidone-carboxylate peptidase
MLLIETPDHAGSRDQAQDLARPLDDDLTGQTVMIDCSNVLVATPSFLDEIVKQILEQRNAATLEVAGAPGRAQALLERAAENRGVRDRLRVATQLP